MATRKRTGFDTPDGKPLWGAALAAHELKALGKAHSIKPKPEPKDCRCGCGEQTKGGDFCMGHDARHKSNLIREAKADSKEAIAELEERGWTKFLEKSLNNDGRKADRKNGIRVVRVYSDGMTDEEKAEIGVRRLMGMKQAHEILKAIGRAPKRVAGDQYIMTTMAVAEALLAGEQTLPGGFVDEFIHLTDAEHEQVRELLGLDAGAKV